MLLPSYVPHDANTVVGEKEKHGISQALSTLSKKRDVELEDVRCIASDILRWGVHYSPNFRFDAKIVSWLYGEVGGGKAGPILRGLQDHIPPGYV